MEKIFAEIFSMSVDSAWLIIAVIIARAILQKSPMYFRKVLWFLVGLRLLIPFSLESSFSLVPQQTQQTADRVVSQAVVPVEEGITFSEVVPVLWIAVGVGFLIYGIVSYIKLKMKISDSILVKDNIYHSDRIESPFVCGFIKPKIYLPYGLDEVTLACVLQHEKTHIKYADHIIKALSFIVLCVHWFNPLVWVAYFLLCKDVELSCDESVIKKYDNNQCKQYAKALLELGVHNVKFTACPVAFGEVSIKTRIKSVINYKKAGKVLVWVSFCLCAIVAICFMTEPDVKAKGNIDKVEMSEDVTEPVKAEVTEPAKEATTEAIAEPTTEPTTEAVTQDSVEQIAEQPVADNYEETVSQTENVYDDSMFENEDDGIDDDGLNRVNVMQPDWVAVPDTPSVYGGITYDNYSSNSGVIGSNPEFPTLASFDWDPAVTN